ncbi:class GN sortase [Marinobacter sp. C2H3]|uniref:class GN sortase n=1 Tax=Marinobacter sp. C2H3 TaxID=3119003 RepID=UPI00300EB31D
MNRLACSAFTACALLVLMGLWIPLKAVVAQQLLDLAWARSQAEQGPVRPWPWADTWPVARMDWPTLSESMVVLDGASGESLAFGPGRLAGTDDLDGPVILAGHRDTHFKRLGDLAPGSPIRLQGRDGRWHDYTVVATRVVDSTQERLAPGRLPDDSLLLVTCYPFDALRAGGPLRYVVTAKAEKLEATQGTGQSLRGLRVM